MPIRFIQLKWIKPDMLLSAGVFSVNKEITAPAPVNI